jgi:phosphoribosylglycinamide formyltransferase-1
MRNIVILISGGGSNMSAIVQAAERDHWEQRFGARVVAVISNRADAKGLEFARARGITDRVVDHCSFKSREEFDFALAAEIEKFDSPQQPALVVLAGFMRILSPAFSSRFAGRLTNIHPSLLPAFAGLHTHQRALDAGCRFAGATVHLVTAELDDGPILDQAVVPVLPGDDAESLAKRVLSQEHLIYPRAIAQLLQAT